MARKIRDPLQVSPQFKKKMAELQQTIMKENGKHISFDDLSYIIANSKELDNLFRDVINKLKQKDNSINFRIKFDRRLL